jgi:hypothetical protein
MDRAGVTGPTMTDGLELSNGHALLPAESSAPSSPPPLPESARRPSAKRAAVDAAFADQMLERLAAGDYAGVVMAAEALLVHQPRHADALDSAQIARSELRRLYIARIGSLQRTPHVIMSYEGMLALSLDFSAGVLLSCVDGNTTIEAIARCSGLPELDALRALSELRLKRVIGFVE